MIKTIMIIVGSLLGLLFFLGILEVIQNRRENKKLKQEIKELQEQLRILFLKMNITLPTMDTDYLEQFFSSRRWKEEIDMPSTANGILEEDYRKFLNDGDEILYKIQGKEDIINQNNII